MSEKNRLTKMYMLMTFQAMKSTRAHDGLPQSLLKNVGPSTQLGGSMPAKSSMIWFHPSPQLMRNSRMSALGTVRKFRLLFSLPPKRVRLKACVRAMANTRKKTSHVASRLPIVVRLAAAVLKSWSSASLRGISSNKKATRKNKNSKKNVSWCGLARKRIDVAKAPPTATSEKTSQELRR